MGVAAYNRGTAGMIRYLHGHGCPCCREYTPTPRPPEWGSKTRAKALKKARGVLRHCARFDKPVPSMSDLADMVQYDTKIGRKTAEWAAEEALA